MSLLAQAENEAQYIDHVLEAAALQQALPHRDQRLLREIVNGVLRHLTYLDLIARNYIRRGYNRFPCELKYILRIALYQLKFLHKIPAYAAIHEAVSEARRRFGPERSRLVNGVLRNYQRNPFAPPHPDGADTAKLAEYYSHPVWLLERFISQYGAEEAIRWMRWNNEVPPVYVRALAAEVDARGLRPHEIAGYYRLERGQRLHELDAWQRGRLIVQDPSAGLAVALLAPAEGETIIDLCAAPGGKAVGLACAVGSAGCIHAVDVSERRLAKVRENLGRVGLENVHLICADARRIDLPAADAVLVDAPCSGLGVLSRRADLRWRRRPEDLPELVHLQKQILAHAARLVKAGSRLVYSTCTIDRAENEEVVMDFLQTHRDFTLQSAAGFVDPQYVTDEGFIRTLPHRHRIDGVFAARLIRIANHAEN